MNERIQALESQCIDPSWTVTGPVFNRDKFAELIVKECAHFMVDIMYHGGVEPEQSYYIMLKRFGVENDIDQSSSALR